MHQVCALFSKLLMFTRDRRLPAALNHARWGSQLGTAASTRTCHHMRLCRCEAQEKQAAAFDCWHTQTRQQAAAARRACKLHTRRMSRLLRAWLQLSTAQQEASQQRISWAQHWCCRRVLRRCYLSWKQQWSSKQGLVEAHRQQQQQEALAQRVLQVGWCHQGQHTATGSAAVSSWPTATPHTCRSMTAQCQQTLLTLCCLQDWQQWVMQQVQQRRAEQQQQHTTAAQVHRQLHSTWATWRAVAAAGQQRAARHHTTRVLHACLAAWLQLPAVNLRLRAICAAVGSVYRQLLQRWGCTAFLSCCSDAAAARRTARQCVRAWCGAAAAGLRQRHAVRARVEGRRRALLQAAVRGWACAAWRASRAAAAGQACELQVS